MFFVTFKFKPMVVLDYPDLFRLINTKWFNGNKKKYIVNLVSRERWCRGCRWGKRGLVCGSERRRKIREVRRGPRPGRNRQSTSKLRDQYQSSSGDAKRILESIKMIFSNTYLLKPAVLTLLVLAYPPNQKLDQNCTPFAYPCQLLATPQGYT